MPHKIFNHIPAIEYKGMQNKDALAFSHYEADREIYGQTMRDHLRFAVCYWHSFNWTGNDVFGEGALPRPWLNKKNNHQDALDKLDAAFDFFERLGAPFFCFHDIDAAADANNIKELTENVKKIAEPMGIKMTDTGVKLLWGTANLFSHPRYMAGAATNPDPEIFKCAAAQVHCMLETTHQLDGENYVLWGGREGYDSLLNTDIKKELDQLARFLTLVVEHKHKIGFKGTILIEPKPHEPTKHQYDRDVATVVSFLERYNLEDEIKLNIEANHATMAGSSFEHEVANAFALNAFGSIDINRGDPQNGWDTDQFHNDPKEMALVMRHILMNGGMKSGGFNFDAKLRRQSIDVEDLFIAHIGGIDNLARGLKNGIKLIEDKVLAGFTKERYQGWFNEEGKKILSGELSLEQLSNLAKDPKPQSGKQEFLENYLNRAIE